MSFPATAWFPLGCPACPPRSLSNITVPGVELSVCCSTALQSFTRHAQNDTRTHNSHLSRRPPSFSLHTKPAFPLRLRQRIGYFCLIYVRNGVNKHNTISAAALSRIPLQNVTLRRWAFGSRRFEAKYFLLGHFDPSR